MANSRGDEEAKSLSLDGQGPRACSTGEATPQLNVLDAAFERQRTRPAARTIYGTFRATIAQVAELARAMEAASPPHYDVSIACRSRVPDVLDIKGQLERLGADLIDSLPGQRPEPAKEVEHV